jgi:hypothetical protein
MIRVLLKGIGRHKVKEGFRVDKSGMPDPPLDRLTDADEPRFTRIMEPGTDPLVVSFPMEYQWVVNIPVCRYCNYSGCLGGRLKAVSLRSMRYRRTDRSRAPKTFSASTILDSQSEMSCSSEYHRRFDRQSW